MNVIDNAQLDLIAGGDSGTVHVTLPEVVIIDKPRPWWMPLPPVRFPWQQ